MQRDLAQGQAALAEQCNMLLEDNNALRRELRTNRIIALITLLLVGLGFLAGVLLAGRYMLMAQ
ncbi:MAG: hypothetical protein CSA07_00030 [Bacteroidia bacterium]|nr:MAG: hypothetical protein CSA07_00030 [Bacteroidia bacterium]